MLLYNFKYIVMAYENTGKALATRWDYVKGGTTTTQKLLNTAGVELEPTDIYLLTDEEYTACFNYTVNYMKNILKWDEVPSISTSIKTDLVLCPLPAPPVPAETRIIEVKFETYETGSRKYRIFFASESEIPTDTQIKVSKVSPAETSTVTVTSSIVSAGGLSYTFSFPDGSTSKTVGNITYKIVPTAITLPADLYGDMIFYAPLTFADRDTNVIDGSKAVASYGETSYQQGENDVLFLNGGTLKFNLPIDLASNDYTFACWAKYYYTSSQGWSRNAALLCFPETTSDSPITNKLNLRSLGFKTSSETFSGPCMGYVGGEAGCIVAKPTTNAWAHFAGTWDHVNRRFKVYLNKVSDPLYDEPATEIAKYTPYFYIGATSVSSSGLTVSGNFNGYIKEVKIWNRIITQEELNAL